MAFLLTSGITGIHNNMESITVEIAKLSLKPGDTLAVMTDATLHNEQRSHLMDMLNSALPEGVKALVLDSGMKLQVITSEHGSHIHAGGDEKSPAI